MIEGEREAGERERELEGEKEREGEKGREREGRMEKVRERGRAAMRIARGVRGHAPPRNFFKTV